MNHNVSYEPYPNENRKRHTKMLAIGSTALALGVILSGCDNRQDSTPPPAPKQQRNFFLAQEEKDFATAYTCSIDSKSLDAVAATADANKHLYFPGYVDVTLDLKLSDAGKQAIANLSNSKTVTTISDVAAKDDKGNVNAPLFTTIPFDTQLPEDAAIQATQDDFKNQLFTVNPDGTATLKSHAQYSLDDKGETKDKEISIVQEIYSSDEVNSFITRGRIACGTIHYDKNKGWQVVNKPIANPVTFTDHATPLNQRPVYITLGK